MSTLTEQDKRELTDWVFSMTEAEVISDPEFKAMERIVNRHLGRSTASLGLATTKELLDELTARIEVHGPGLGYRTVDHHG